MRYGSACEFYGRHVRRPHAVAQHQVAQAALVVGLAEVAVAVAELRRAHEEFTLAVAKWHGATCQDPDGCPWW